MNTTLAIGLIVLNIILIIVLGFFGYLMYRLLKERQQPQLVQTTIPEPTQENSTTHYHPEIKKRMEDVAFTNPVKSDIFCPYHPTEPGEVQCGMCARYFCSRCVRPMKSIYFCKEHMALYLRNHWTEVLTIKTNSSDPENGVRLYERKQQLFIEQQIPTYVETHYKIEVDSDFIETYLVLFAMEENVEEVRKYIEQ